MGLRAACTIAQLRHVGTILSQFSVRMELCCVRKLRATLWDFDNGGMPRTMTCLFLEPLMYVFLLPSELLSIT